MGRVLFVMTLTLPVGARPSGIMYEGIAIFLADLPIADLDSEINVWIRTCQEFRWGAILLSQWCHQVLNLADSHCLAKKRATSVHLQRISYIWHWLAGRLSWPVMPKTNQFSSQDIRLIEATEKRRRMANGSTLPCRTICLNWWSGNLLLNDITRRITNPTTRSQVFPSSLTLAPRIVTQWSKLWEPPLLQIIHVVNDKVWKLMSISSLRSPLCYLLYIFYSGYHPDNMTLHFAICEKCSAWWFSQVLNRVYLIPRFPLEIASPNLFHHMPLPGSSFWWVGPGEVLCNQMHHCVSQRKMS